VNDGQLVVRIVLFRNILQSFIPSLAPERPSFIRTPFGDSMRRLYNDAEFAWMAHGSLGKRWTHLHYLFGLATVILAAAAGFGGLGALFNQRTAAWIALAAAVVAAISTFLNTDEQRKRHDELAAAWDNFRQDVDNIYSFAPGAAERIQYSRDYEASYRDLRAVRRSGEKSDLVMPPDPEGWQMFVKRLQARANALRRQHKDMDEDVGTWPWTGNSEGGHAED